MNEKMGWSFCIVTAPNNEAILKQCIKKIHDEFERSDDYEIIVVGNPKIEEKEILKKTKIISFKEEVFHLSLKNIKIALREKNLKRIFFRTGAICHKKNLAAKNAKYNKLCIMHDYVGLEPGWKVGWEKFGEDWEIGMNIILNKDGSRHRDWMAWDHPKLTNKSNGSGACLIPYDKWTKYMYISGTYFCVKRKFFLENPLNENLFWGEGEDVEWSLRVREKTKFKMNTFSVVKYLKQKPLNDAPYCESWRKNEKLMKEILEKELKDTKKEVL